MNMKTETILLKEYEEEVEYDEYDFDRDQE